MDPQSGSIKLDPDPELFEENNLFKKTIFKLQISQDTVPFSMLSTVAIDQC